MIQETEIPILAYFSDKETKKGDQKWKMVLKEAINYKDYFIPLYIKQNMNNRCS